MTAATAPDITRSRRPGRPSDPRVRDSILRATRRLLVEGGYAELSIERIAERAGVGKPTIYRRWPSKGALVWEAVLGKSVVRSLPDSGNVRDDLCTILLWGVEQTTAPEAHAALPGMLMELRADPELERLLRAGPIEREHARIRTVLERAVVRGELRAEVDLDLVLDTLIGTVLGRALLLDHPLDERFIDAIIDLTLTGAAKSDRQP
jgi:AcrR family transcriptional regulator